MRYRSWSVVVYLGLSLWPQAVSGQEPTAADVVAPAVPESHATAARAPSAVRADMTSRRFLGQGPAETRVVDRLRQAPVARFKSIGNSSVVFRLSMPGGSDAALKLPSTDREYADLGEIAAYRLAATLGIDNVPPAVTRRVTRSLIQRRLHADSQTGWPSLRARIVWDADAGVRGAAIHWVPGLQELGPQGAEIVSRWTQWLQSRADIPEQSLAVVADFSTMLAFDYLIGNWDRFSGANIQLDAAGRRIVMRDHDAAFPARLSTDLHRRILERVLRVRHFSRSFVEQLTALDEEALLSALAQDPGTKLESWLQGARLRGLMERRATLLSHVGALMREHGAHQTLAFP